MGLETAYCVCTAEKTKTKIQLSGKFAHNLRLHDVKNADPSKRGLNEILIGDENVKDIFQISAEDASKRNKNKEFKTYIDSVEELKSKVEKETGTKVRKDAVLAIELVLTYSASASENISVEEWKEANVKWLKEYFDGGDVPRDQTCLSSVVYHGDESTDHIHAIILPRVYQDPKTKEVYLSAQKAKLEGKDDIELVPRFNAKHWLGGKKLLAQMQTSYAEAMSKFGLTRGEQNSRASHQDLQTFYRALNNVVRQKLPPRNQFQDEQSYQNAIDEIYKEATVRMFALEQAIKRLEAVDKTRESNNSIYRDITESRIKDYEEQIQILKSDLSEAEKKAKFVDNMQTAIQTIEMDDPDRAEKIRENLNNLSRKGGALEKAFARKAAQAAQASQESGPDSSLEER